MFKKIIDWCVDKNVFKKWYFWVGVVVVISMITAPFIPDDEIESVNVDITTTTTEIETSTTAQTDDETIVPEETESETTISEIETTIAEPETESTTTEPVTTMTEPITTTPAPTTTTTSAPTTTTTPVPTTTTSKDSDITVYITNTGKKYHLSTCRYTEDSCIPIKLEKAKNDGYEPCGTCHPPK